MIQVAFSQIETRVVNLGLETPAAIPVAIAAGASQKLQFSTTVPMTEHWFLLGMGLICNFDSNLVTITGGYGRVRSRSEQAIFGGVYFPTNLSNFLADATGTISVSLSGVEASQGDNLTIVGSVLNSDSVTRNISTIEAQCLVRPARLTTDIELANFSRSQANDLSQRLNFGGGR